MKKQQSGFTLVEIAIVMVIIGLLLGGVLKGQEVITNAKIKNINNDFAGISAAVYSYQDRYSTLPGDDLNADAHVNGGIVSTAGTQGNGIIEGNWYAAGSSPAVGANGESVLAWQHLRAAGLLSGDITSSIAPLHAFGGRIGIEDTLNGMNGTVIVFENLAGDIAAILDSQNDDGVPNTGSVRNSGNLAAYLFTGVEYDIAFGL